MYCTTFPSHSPQYSVDPTFQRCKTLSCDFLKHVKKRFEFAGDKSKTDIYDFINFRKIEIDVDVLIATVNEFQRVCSRAFLCFLFGEHIQPVGIRRSGCFGGQVATRGLTDIPVD